MKQSVVALGLVMSMTMSAMDSGERAEGAGRELSPEVAQMPDNPRKSPKRQVSPATKKAIQESFRKQHGEFLAKLKAEAEQNNQ